MNPDAPVIPDPADPNCAPEPVSDPSPAGQPDSIQAANDDGLDDYDRADEDSFPASDPPAAAEPGVP